MFYFQIPIFQQEEAAKEMKEKQKKELEKLKHLDLSEYVYVLSSVKPLFLTNPEINSGILFLSHWPF